MFGRGDITAKRENSWAFPKREYRLVGVGLIVACGRGGLPCVVAVAGLFVPVGF